MYRFVFISCLVWFCTPNYLYFLLSSFPLSPLYSSICLYLSLFLPVSFFSLCLCLFSLSVCSCSLLPSFPLSLFPSLSLLALFNPPPFYLSHLSLPLSTSPFLSAISQILASCSYDNTIRFFHEEDDDWSSFATLEGHESTVWAISFDKTGSRLASSSDDKTVKIWQEYQPGNPEGTQMFSHRGFSDTTM